jgi:hypothetical protein
VPTGGSTGQFLVKASGTSYDTAWQTLSLTGYATESWVNSQGYLTSSALTPYLQKAGGVITGDILSYNGSGLRSIASGSASTYTNVTSDGIAISGGSGPGSGAMSINWDGITFVSSPYKQTQPFLGLSGYATESWVTAGFAPIAAGQPTGGTVGQVLTKQSGTAYDSSWATLIPGDRYLTSSTTSLTINNQNKTLTVGTGLSYTSQQDIVIAHDATHHMHARVTTYNSSTGVMDVDVISHTGTGTYASWTVNVGGTPALASVVWGDITGTLGNQTDLANALNAKLEVTTAASTYQTQSGMSAYLAKADNLSGLASTSTARTNLGLGTLATVNDAPSNGSQYARKNGAWDIVAAAGASVTISATAPASPSAGDLWLRSTDYRTFTWTGAQWIESSAGYLAGVGTTFETVSKNLKAYPSTLAYSGGNLTSITYALGGGLTIVKTLAYTGSNLTSIVLSGSTPSGISLTKTLTYSAGNLVGITYS